MAFVFDIFAVFFGCGEDFTLWVMLGASIILGTLLEVYFGFRRRSIP